ncbi:MAG TPA: AsmA family protein, partial [Beijerinckiaceae bacterium]|nr:AsmA family protein [Beijerinckiaceae bacterium]
MRDILTVLAAVLILILSAALIAPPFVDWESRRAVLDDAFARAVGTAVETEGAIAVRLLPSPRVRLDRLRIGTPAPDAPSFLGEGVTAEVELPALLRGEVRFREARVERAEMRLPVPEKGGWRLPEQVGARPFGARWAFEDLFVDRLEIVRVASGASDERFFVEEVHVAGQSLAGPWQVQGRTDGVPFRLATGELTPEQTLQVKLTGGGDQHPRFEVDGKVAFAGEVEVAGTARLLYGPPAQDATVGLPVAASIQAAFKTADGAVGLETVTIEAGEIGGLRLTGTGRIGVRDPGVALALEGRRVDLDGFLQSPAGAELWARLDQGGLPAPALPLSVDLTLTSVALGNEELTNVAFRGGLAGGRLAVERLEFGAPGQARVVLSGEAAVAAAGGAHGRVEVAAPASDRFGRYLVRLGLLAPNGFVARLLDGQPLEASAEVTLADPRAAVRDLRVRLGEARLSGEARYAAPAPGRRGSLEAEIALAGLDLARLPHLSSIFEATEDLDVGFVLDARDVRHGKSGEAGRITARIVSDGPALLVESLDVLDLAGANARVSGRIAPDGSGRIAGRVVAANAAPLVDLLGTVWIGGAARFVPDFVRAGAIDLQIAAERAEGGAAPRLRTSATGRAAGGTFEGEVLSVDGATESVAVRLATDNAGHWLGRADDPALRRASALRLDAVRAGLGRFAVRVSGEVAGARIETTRAFSVGLEELVESGEAVVNGDLAPFLPLLGPGARVAAPVPSQLRLGVNREGERTVLDLGGKVAGEGVQARLSIASAADVTGTVAVDRLSLPWLAGAFGFDLPLDAAPGATWPATRFGQSSPLLRGGAVGIRAKRLDLGRGFLGEDARFTVAPNPDGVAVRDLDMALAGGRLAGAFTIGRQGGQASFVGEGRVRDLALPGLLGASPFEGRLSGTLRFGAAGESPAAIVMNLSGAGDVRIEDLLVPAADPGAPARALDRALADAEPLAPGRLEAVVAEELNRGPLRAPLLSAPVTLVGGALRMSPAVAEAGAAAWRGALAFDLKTLALDADGAVPADHHVGGGAGPFPRRGGRCESPVGVEGEGLEVEGEGAPPG